MKFLAVALLATIVATAKENSEETIQQAHIIFKYGDRTPEQIIGFNNNPHVNETLFPYGHGELTLKGKRASYKLGKLLQARYNKFLGNLYYKDLLQAYSSNLRRTQMSLLTVLAAMFKPTNAWKIENGMNWQPIPYTIPCPDKLIATYLTCSKVLNVKTKNIDKETQYIYDYLSEYTGQSISNSFDVFAIYNTMQVQVEQGYELPSWAKPIWNKTYKNAALQFWKDVSNQHLGDIVGNLLYKIVQDTQNKITGISPQKLYMYSGHDFNYVAILTALDAFDGTDTRYSAYVTIELHKKDDVYGYQIYKYNYDTDKPCPVEIPDCGFFCPVEEFYEKIVAKIYKGNKWCDKASIQVNVN